MQLKGIKGYSSLLCNIARQLGKDGEEAYNFAKKEKANFSKMLNGQRQLKYEFIIPLERIFGVSLARLLDENAYRLPIEKQNVPFIKGFRYYAYLDNADLYENEFNTLLAKDGKSILNYTDEFGKTFLDYIVEYRAVNGVRYLHDEYGITLKWYYNRFDLKTEKESIWCDFENLIEFARLVADMNDADLFNDIFDSYNMFYTNGHYGDFSSLYYNPEYLEILLDNETLFDSLFEIKKYELKLNKKEQAKYGKGFQTYYSINPILNNCLNYALKHLNRYKAQALKILEFGVNHDNEIACKYNLRCYVCNKLGGIKVDNNEEVYECAIVLPNNTTTHDKEIDDLVKQFNLLFIFDNKNLQ